MRVLWRLLLATVLVGSFSGTAHAARFLITGADAGGGPHVIVRVDTNNDGTFDKVGDSFFAFGPTSPGGPLFTGGVRVAACDFDGDGNDELITAMGPGNPGGSLVRIWKMTGGGQAVELQDEFKPYGAFNGGVFVACGDFDGDGRDELVTAPDIGGGPHVIVWHDVDRDGKVSDDPPLSQFLAYISGFTGGVRVAAGDVNNNGPDELITAPGPGGGPHIRVLTFTGGAFVPIDEFFAYTPAFSGGVYVAAGRMEAAGTGGAEIITAPGAGGGPHIRIFSDADADGMVSDDPTFDEFFAYTPAFSGGVRIAAGDTDASGTFVEVVTIPGPGGGPDVRIFDDNGDAGSKISDNPTDDEFFAYDPAWVGGGFVAVGQYLQSAFAYPAFPVAIPDNASISLVACVPQGAGIIRDLDVGLSIAHNFNVDLDVTLQHLSTGTAVTLFTDVGNNDKGFVIRLNDQSGTDIAAATNDPNDGAVFGVFRPEAPALLSTFNGEDASGCWRLTVTDDATLDTGTLFNWILYFTF
jgi:subtilisin-like proprotein convertase family protein